MSKAEKEAEWRGAVSEALKTVQSHIVALDSVARSLDNRLRETEVSTKIMNRELGETRDAIKSLEKRLESSVSNLQSAISRIPIAGGMSTRTKATLYGTTIVAVFGFLGVLAQAILNNMH